MPELRVTDERLRAVMAFPTPGDVEVRVAWGTDGFVRVSLLADDEASVDRWLANAEREIRDVIRDAWPVHQPAAPDAPIPGRHWYSRCDESPHKIDPKTGRCEGCGEKACRECGREDCPDHEEA